MEVTFEEGSALKRIGREAFAGCTRFKSIQFPDGLQEIGLLAFEESALRSVEFPASLRTVAQGAFARCGSLKTAVFRDGLEVLGTDEQDSNGDMFRGVFEDSVLENVELPKTLRRVE